MIEDCAEAPGATYRGRRVGTWGDAAIFSFQHNKPMTAGEGGLIATRDLRLYERAVRLHDLGQYRAPHAAITPAREPAFAGGQYRMSELTAAVALTLVAEGSLPDIADTRYVKRPLAPGVSRQVGLAVLDRRQSSPATLAFIKLASSLDYR